MTSPSPTYQAYGTVTTKSPPSLGFPGSILIASPRCAGEACQLREQGGLAHLEEGRRCRPVFRSRFLRSFKGAKNQPTSAMYLPEIFGDSSHHRYTCLELEEEKTEDVPEIIGGKCTVKKVGDCNSNDMESN